MIRELIEAHFGLAVGDVKLLDSHFGTSIYLILTDQGKYIAKTMPLSMGEGETEGEICDFLYDRGISVARLLKSKENRYVVTTPEAHLTVQPFIEGENFAPNTAPAWLMAKSAQTLGAINAALADYKPLPVRFGKDFFARETALNKMRRYEEELLTAQSDEMRALYRRQISHLKRVSAFSIDTDRLTYANSHGDYHIGQIIAQNGNITVIDWASACRMPVCLEVIASYVVRRSVLPRGRDRFGRAKALYRRICKVFCAVAV